MAVRNRTTLIEVEVVVGEEEVAAVDEEDQACHLKTIISKQTLEGHPGAASVLV